MFKKKLLKPKFNTKADLIEYLAKGLVKDTANPNRFGLIYTTRSTKKKKIWELWDYTWTLFGRELLNMFLSTYGYVPSLDELKLTTKPFVSVIVGGDGIIWEVGVQYVHPELLPFNSCADYEAMVLDMPLTANEIIGYAIANLESR